MADARANITAALQYSISQTFSGMLLKTNPMFTFARVLTEKDVPNFPMNVSGNSASFKIGSKDFTPLLSYSMNQPAPAPDVVNESNETFGDPANVNDDSNPSIIMRPQTEKLYRFGVSQGLENADHQYLSKMSSLSDLTNVEDAVRGYREVFGSGEVNLIQGKIAMMFASLAARLSSFCRLSYAKHANIVTDISTVPVDELDADKVLTALKYTTAAMTSFHGKSTIESPLLISAPPYIQQLLTSTNSLAWLSNRGASITSEYMPSSSRFFSPMGIYSDGTTIYPDSDSIEHVAGTASTLTDLTIKVNPFGLAAANWNTFDTCSKAVNTITIASAAGTAFTFKAGDVIEVGTDLNYIKLRARSLELLASGDRLSSSFCPLRLIVQEDVTATGKEAVIKVNDLWHGYNVHAKDFAAAVKVSVVGDHLKMFIAQRDRLFKKMFYNAFTAGVISPMSIYDIFGAEDAYGGGMAGNVFSYVDPVQRVGPVFDLSSRINAMTNATFFATDNFHAQILLPLQNPSVKSFETVLKTRTVT